MPALTSARIDMIEELMYRCWARRNYLPLELREADWHPIILEEMALRDEELFEELHQQESMNRTLGSGFVPLDPSITHFVHPAQSESASRISSPLPPPRAAITPIPSTPAAFSSRAEMTSIVSLLLWRIAWFLAGSGPSPLQYLYCAPCSRNHPFAFGEPL
jgi:hypothetical protein